MRIAFALLLLLPLPGWAASVEIAWPPDGGEVPADRNVLLEYSADPGATGDHVHVSVDGGPPRVVRALAGKQELGELAPGRHRVVVQLVDADHRPTGAEATATFRVAPP